MSYILRTHIGMSQRFYQIFNIPDSVNANLIINYINIIYSHKNTIKYEEVYENIIGFENVEFLERVYLKKKNIWAIKTDVNRYIDYKYFINNDDVLKINKEIFEEIKKIILFDKTYDELYDMAVIKNVIK